MLLENEVDIACITETWLNAEYPTESVDITDYVCVRRDRSSGRQGGGLACCVRHDLPFSRMKELEKPDLESLWLLYRSPRMPRWVSHIGVGVIYNPPGANDRLMSDHIISCVDVITKQHPYAVVVVAGDFNRLRDASLCCYPLKQTVKTATRGAVVLDKIYTNIADW